MPIIAAWSDEKKPRRACDGLMAVLREICGTTDDAVRKRRLDAFIAECLRFRPVSPVLFRICAQDTTVNDQPVYKGDLVCSLIQAANMDQGNSMRLGTSASTAISASTSTSAQQPDRIAA